MKQRMIKVLNVFVLALGMIIMSGTSIYASNDNHGMVPSARVCGCGKGTYVVSSKNYGSWYTSSQKTCKHHTYGTDLIQKRAVTTTYKCNYCGRGYSTSSSESRTVCHGYNS